MILLSGGVTLKIEVKKIARFRRKIVLSFSGVVEC
jgi:hypothetical protein